MIWILLMCYRSHINKCSNFSHSYVTFPHRDKDHRQGGRTNDDSSRHRERPLSGPLTSTGERAAVDNRPANGAQGPARPAPGMSLHLFPTDHT